MEITYKEFFEKSKTRPELQSLVGTCLVAAINVSQRAKKVYPDEPPLDAGILMLGGLETMAKMEGVTLTEKEEIDAEYMADILNSYGVGEQIGGE